MSNEVIHVHTHTHSVLTAIFPGEPELAKVIQIIVKLSKSSHMYFRGTL